MSVWWPQDWAVENKERTWEQLHLEIPNSKKNVPNNHNESTLHLRLYFSLSFHDLKWVLVGFIIIINITPLEDREREKGKENERWEYRNPLMAFIIISNSCTMAMMKDSISINMLHLLESIISSQPLSLSSSCLGFYWKEWREEGMEWRNNWW